ncbi:MAG: hypothetical protein M3065_16505 [Actinomycetota bacterium]|nr:hypothetical protein [Actinomycetota bacterium]
MSRCAFVQLAKPAEQLAHAVAAGTTPPEEEIIEALQTFVARAVDARLG